MEDWSESPAKRSYAHYDDDRFDGDDPDERIGSNDREDRDDSDDSEDRDDSRHKRRRASDSEVSGYGASDVEYRILCPVSRIGAVIGKGGSIIKSLRLDTKAKIKVEDAIHGSDERVIYLSSAPGRDKDQRDRDSRDDDCRRGLVKDEMLCPAQEALFRIHHCITLGEDNSPASDEEDDEDEPPPQVTTRLLVPDSQVGCLIGKGGRIIEQMRKDIAAQIRVLPKASLPPCAYPNDELVQLSGTPALVKKALYAVSSKLYENPLRERARRPSGVSQGAGVSLYSSSFHGAGSMMGMGCHGRSGTGNSGAIRSGRTDGSPDEELMVCILCPNDKIGSMIGKGGSVVRKLREDSGAKIKVCDRVEDSDERIIQISAIEQYMDNNAFPVLEAVLQVSRRLNETYADKDGKNGILSIRLLVRAHQIGCLLGKGGQIITEMRRSSRANIRIPPKDELPRCADEGSELVQVSGEPPLVEAALVQVLTKLRSNLFKGRDLGHGSHHQGGGYRGRDDPISPRGYSHDYGNYSTSPGVTHSFKDSCRRPR